MSRIRIYDSTTTTLLGTVADVFSAARTERLNSDNILTFTAPLTAELEPLIAGGNVAELDGDYFDIVYYRKGQQTDGSLTVDVECEHISYRLNRSTYDLEFFTQTGTPAAVLAEILDGTGFTVGTVEPTAAVTYSAQEKTSRRMLLMDFVATVEGEVDFDQFEISILTARGSATPIDLTATRDIDVIDKTYNAREQDSAGNPLVSYTCTMIRPVAVALGDVVALDYPAIDTDVELRVVSITTNPYNRYEVSFEIGNFIPGLADDAYRIETSTLGKGRSYYGARISPENGFESIRNDKMARTVMNADTFAMQKGDGSGSSWTDVLYFNAATGEYVFDGQLSAGLISALEAEFDVTISNVFITNTLTAQKGYIAELTVDEIDTSRFIPMYLASNKAKVKYWRGYEQRIDFYHATYAGDIEGQPNTVQVTDRNGTPIYWIDAEHIGNGWTYDVTDYPVMRYVYDGVDGKGILKLAIRDDNDPETGYDFPMMIWGAGNHVGKQKGYIYKDSDEMVMSYENASGEMREIRLGEDGISITPFQLEAIAFNSGGFSATYSGETMVWTWTLDGTGRITALTNEDGTVPVTWG